MQPLVLTAVPEKRDDTGSVDLIAAFSVRLARRQASDDCRSLRSAAARSESIAAPPSALGWDIAALSCVEQPRANIATPSSCRRSMRPARRSRSAFGEAAAMLRTRRGENVNSPPAIQRLQCSEFSHPTTRVSWPTKLLRQCAAW
jgi:hypothetical protein